MCIICTSTQDELALVETLNCPNCPLLTAIPLLSSLVTLYCHNCPLLTVVPMIPSLTTLYCSSCPALTEVPLLPSLTTLNCSDCPLLAGLVPASCTHVYATNSPWLDCNATSHAPHRNKFIRIQRWIKANRRIHLLIWMRTGAYNEWMWSPTGPGGVKHKLQLDSLLNARPSKEAKLV